MGQFTRLYIAYAACIEGYLAGYRPLIFFADTFLKDRSKGTLFTATTYGGDNRLFLLAFCMYDIANEDNWNWFISELRKMLYEVPEPYALPHQLVFMSDTDKGLGSTI